MNALEGLKYKDSTKVTRYMIDFNCHARCTGWNEQALARCYYKGLLDRLKDEIARIGKPTGLLPLRELVATLDQRYWEHQLEVSRDKRSTSSQQSAGKQQSSTKGHSDNRNNNNNNNNNNNSGNKLDKPPHQNQQSQNKGKDQKKPVNANANASASSSSGAKPNSIANLLGPD
jgi:hypothetical protein